MKRWLMVIALILIPFLSGCPAQVRPTMTENGPGLEVVIGGETAEKIESGVEKIEGFIKVANDLLPIIAGAAEKIGEATGNEKEGKNVYLHAYDAKKGQWQKVSGEYDGNGNFCLLVK